MERLSGRFMDWGSRGRRFKFGQPALPPSQLSQRPHELIKDLQRSFPLSPLGACGASVAIDLRRTFGFGLNCGKHSCQNERLEGPVKLAESSSHEFSSAFVALLGVAHRVGHCQVTRLFSAFRRWALTESRSWKNRRWTSTTTAAVTGFPSSRRRLALGRTQWPSCTAFGKRHSSTVLGSTPE